MFVIKPTGKKAFIKKPVDRIKSKISISKSYKYKINIQSQCKYIHKQTDRNTHATRISGQQSKYAHEESEYSEAEGEIE